MDINLKNKVCLITGCDAGVGLGLVRGFLKRGARVAAGLLDREKSVAAVKPALGLQMDVTRQEEVAEAAEATLDAFGRIDVLVNNAGIYPRTSAEELTYAEWNRVLDINLQGAFRTCEAVIPHFIEQESGVILNIGSIAYRLGMANLVHYESSKGGIVGMTRGLARDLGKHGVRVNCIHLGAVRTEGELALFPDQEALLEEINKHQASPGRMTPESVEPVFAFLASEASRDITGQCLTVDRGWTHGG